MKTKTKFKTLNLRLTPEDYQALKAKQTKMSLPSLTSLIEFIARNKIIFVDENVKTFSAELLPLFQEMIREAKK